MAKRTKNLKRVAQKAANALAALAELTIEESQAKSGQYPATNELMVAAMFLAEAGVLDMFTAAVRTVAKGCGKSTRGTLLEVAARIANEREAGRA